MQNLGRLAELARDNTPEGRRALVDAVTDMFMTAASDQVDHISLLFGDIVLKVIGKLEEEARMALAVRICEAEAAPRDLIMSLAADRINVAAPVLAGSPVLTTDDLVSLAKTGSMDHLGVIADRRPLNEAVTSVIVSRGNTEVLATVAGNEQARFTANAFEMLLEKARHDPMIQEALIGREDLPADGARNLVPYLSEELKKRILDLGGDGTLVQILAERAAQEVQAQVRDLGSAQSRAKMLIDDVKARRRPIDDAVNQFSKTDRPVDLAHLLAEVSELPTAMVARVVFNTDDAPLIILCRANGVTDNAYKNIVKLRAQRLKMSGQEINDAFLRYGRMQRAEAMRALAVIRERAKKAS